MIQSNTSSPRRSEVPLESHRRLWQLKSPQNEEISRRRKNGEKKEASFAIRWRGANRGGYTLRNDSEEELLRKMLTPT